MTAEHWRNEDGTEHALVPSTASWADRKAMLAGTPIKCCEIEGETWEQCVAWYKEYVSPGEN